MKFQRTTQKWKIPTGSYLLLNISLAGFQPLKLIIYISSKRLMKLTFITSRKTKYDCQLPSTIASAICFEHRIHSPDVSDTVDQCKCRGKLWDQIRWLIQEQSHLGPHCLTKRPPKHIYLKIFLFVLHALFYNA